MSTQDIASDHSEDQKSTVPSIEIHEDSENDGRLDHELTSEEIRLLREAFPQQQQSSPMSTASPMSPTSKPPLSKRNSLQVPSFRFDTNALANLNDSEIAARSYIDDKDLEKKFNNIVFSFKTDQYTLQKRLENQVCFFMHVMKVEVILDQNKT